jgi:methionyl-tRNA synthetase
LVYLQPFMPATAEKGLAYLGWRRGDESLDKAGRWGVLPSGATVAPSGPLFPRKQ